MAPTLVRATAPYTAYPGGVVALRASDWMAPARGTLTTAVDADACSGHRVQDSQKQTGFTGDPFGGLAAATAYAAADDTLVIPLTSLPLDASFGYDVYISYRIVGDWDITNTDTLIHSTQWTFGGVAALGLHGIDYTNGTPIVDYAYVEFYTLAIARTPHYVHGVINGQFQIDSTETMHIRAFTATGTTATWYIDQIIMVPDGALPPHDSFEQTYPFPNWNFSVISTLTLTDGADGGDTWGKFTTGGVSFVDAGQNNVVFDYQRKANSSSAEYLLRLDVNDGFQFHGPANAELSAHVYSQNCVRWRPGSDIVAEHFSRVVAPGSLGEWEQSPEGYDWSIGGTFGPGVETEVDGSEGIHRVFTTVPAEIQSNLGLGGSGAVGARLKISDAWSFTGKFRLVGDATWLASPDGFVDVRVWVPTGDLINWGLRFTAGHGTDVDHPGAGYWELWYSSQGGIVPYTILTSGSAGWYADGVSVGFRLEVTRYDWKFRLWDASGAEPGTWDFEGFKQLRIAPGTAEAYPYSNDVRHADDAYSDGGPFTVRTDTDHIDGQVEVRWDDIIVTYDPLGTTPTSMFANLEAPEGTEVATMEIPFGASYFVYWGVHDMTDIVTGIPYERFSAKVWNDPAAPELQRAEVSVWMLVASTFVAKYAPIWWDPFGKELSRKPTVEVHEK